MNKNKKLHIVTFGCQMNTYDSDKIALMLEKLGYELTDSPEAADMILLNTCSVREGPENKVTSQLGRFKKLKEKNEELILGVGGCVAQQQGEKLLKQVKYLDIVFGTDSLPILPEIIEEHLRTKKRIAQTTEQDSKYYKFVDIEPQEYEENKFSELVKIMKGCNKRCSYCIVPYTRGKEISKPFDKIILETKKLADRGIKEIMLLGQTVNSYGRDLKGGKNFSELLRELNKISGIERIRYTSPHPKYYTKELMNTIAELDKVMNHIHMPIQSGSNAVLKHMKRQYTREQFIEQIEYMRSLMPELEVTTDMIVGYPTETEKEFEETLELMKIIKFDNAFSFAYSPRPLTSIYNMEEKMSDKEKKVRLRILQDLQEVISRENTSKHIGNIEEILLEKTDDGRFQNQFSGRTRGNRKLFLNSVNNYKVGDIFKVKVTKGVIYSLEGELL